MSAIKQPDMARAQADMIALLRKRGIKQALVLSAMGMVPREAFVPSRSRSNAYDDAPLPIAENQTISQPYVVALMIEAAGVAQGSRVLEIGAGSGYSTAIMSAMGAQVRAVERHESLAADARTRLAALGYEAEIRTGDGTLGWPEHAPYDAIIVTAGGPKVPEALKSQLAVGGRLVIPVGLDMREQSLQRVTRATDQDFSEESLGAVSFVPLIGDGGWPG